MALTTGLTLCKSCSPDGATTLITFFAL